jgi:subtilisin-like proprotein convertase family protein
VGEANAANVSASLLSSNGIASLTPEQSYGTLSTNDPAVSRDFTFTVSAPIGRVLQAQLLIKTNGVPSGYAVFDVPVGDSVLTYERLHLIDVPEDKSRTFGPASEYPSTITVSNLDGTITALRVTLHNFEHQFPEDINALLIAPSGTNVMLMSDCGGAYSMTNVNLTFDSGITNLITTQGDIFSGTYSATDYNYPNSMAPPAPTTPAYGTSLGQFKRLNPNGDWQLYLYDNLYEDIGVLRGGWSLTLTIIRPPVLSIRDNGDGRMRITLTGTGNRSFLLDYSTNLVDWQLLGQLPANDTVVFFDSPAGQLQRFFRTRRNTP